MKRILLDGVPVKPGAFFNAGTVYLPGLNLIHPDQNDLAGLIADYAGWVVVIPIDWHPSMETEEGRLISAYFDMVSIDNMLNPKEKFVVTAPVKMIKKYLKLAMANPGTYSVEQPFEKFVVCAAPVMFEHFIAFGNPELKIRLASPPF